MNSIEVLPAPVTHPVTPLQFGMIYHHLREGGGTGIDIVQVEVVLSPGEEASLEEMAAAWQRVVDQEPALRTSFTWEGTEEPRAQVHSSVPVSIETLDLRSPTQMEAAGGPGAAGEPCPMALARYQAHLEADRARGFDLGQAPLFRLLLAHLPGGERRLVWTLHHLVADGQSYRLVLARVFEALQAGNGAAPSRPAGPPPAALARWIQQRDESGDEAFWRKALAGITAPTTLPRRVGGSRTPGRWAFHPIPLPGVPGAPAPENGSDEASDPSLPVARGLERLARAEGVTVNTLIQGAWALALGTFTGAPQVTFGAIRGGRGGTVEWAERGVGLYINTVPLAVDVDPDASLRSFLQGLRERWVAMRAHEHASPSRVQGWSGVPSGQLLFESVLNVQAPFWGDGLVEDDPSWSSRSVELYNPLVFPLTVAVNVGGRTPGLRVRLEFDPGELDVPRIEALGDLFAGYLGALAGLGWEASATLPTLGDLDPLPPEVREQVVVAWNATDRPLPQGATVHGLVAEAAARTPDAEALVSGGVRRSYRELEADSAAMARALRALGVGEGDRVAVSMGRGVELPAALLGVMRIGAAYVPVDPAYPEARVTFKLHDAAPAALITDRAHLGRLVVPEKLPVLVVEDVLDAATSGGAHPDDAAPLAGDPEGLAYMIYTSGSTGQPKGVMVEHRNVVNFFVGMDEAVGVGPGDRWYAVTSISFDISVLEILWTLSRGATVVLHNPQASSSVASSAPVAPPSTKTLDFSLFFFSSEGEEGAEPPTPGRHRYRLLLEGAAFADRNGFSAVWTPERHFHEFGGIYPNPSVVGGALAAFTERVRIRAGSVVLPLHDPIRVAEEWSVVDNLSNGRVDLSFASGWHDRDFIFRPEAFSNRKEGMFAQMREVQHLWRGGSVERVGPSGVSHAVTLHPRPVQPELPVFVTAGGTPETFRQAGEVGANLLTHLLGQRPEELAEKIRIYREARRAAGHPGEGHVALMLHTWVGSTMDEVRDTVRGPFRSYLSTAVGLIRAVAEEGGKDLREAQLTPAEMEALLDHAFERYFETSSLMGDVDRCVTMAERMRELGADEIACLIDFGVEEERVLEGLDRLAAVARAFGARGAEAEDGRGVKEEVALPVTEAILQTGATHLQCTPSQAALLLAEDRAAEALGQLQVLLLGGEALPGALVARLREQLDPEARLLNMYGPTETTVWSAVREVEPGDAESAVVPLGPPVANTRLLVVDARDRPVPVGVEGDLLIGGEGVVRGYFQRPELTTERFIPSPVPEWSGRFYRTGDRVRRRHDGGFDFAGRADHQVKLRGHRIELGEIEAALASRPDVAAAVVLLEGEAEGMPRLVAWLVPATGAVQAELSRNALRGWLRDRLPEIMIPSDVRVVESFPLTPNGKVDRARVPEMGRRAGSDPGSETVSPVGSGSPAAPPVAPGALSGATSPVAAPVPEAPVPSGVPRAHLQALQGQVRGLWSELLGVETVGLNDNFFEIGGHSLLAVRVHSRLSEEVGGRLSLVDLFRFPTVATLAAHLATLVAPSAPSPSGVDGEARDRVESRRDSMASLRARRAAGRPGTIPQGGEHV
jgi:natural product biosynthesis luciferase-like monooxygenase protein